MGAHKSKERLHKDKEKLHNDNEQLTDVVLQNIAANFNGSFKHHLVQELLNRRWARALQAVRDSKAIWLKITFTSKMYGFTDIIGIRRSFEFLVGDDVHHNRRRIPVFEFEANEIGKAAVLFFSRYRRFRYLCFDGFECEEIIRPLNIRKCWPIQVDYLEMCSRHFSTALIEKLSPLFKKLHVHGFPIHSSLEIQPFVELLLKCHKMRNLSISNGFNETICKPFAEYFKIANIDTFSSSCYQLWHFEALQLNKHLRQLSYVSTRNLLLTLNKESLTSIAVITVINKLRCIRFHLTDSRGSHQSHNCSIKHQLIALDRGMSGSLTRLHVTHDIQISGNITEQFVITPTTFYLQMLHEIERLFVVLALDFSEAWVLADQITFLNKFESEMDIVVRSSADNRVRVLPFLHNRRMRIRITSASPSVLT